MPLSFSSAHAEGGYILSGKVIASGTNLPVGGARVTIAPKEGGKEKRAVTTKDGGFSFGYLSIGYYTIKARATGFVETIVSDIAITKKDVGPIIITLGKGGSISGKVIGPDGSPVRDAVVEATGNRGRTVTDQNGNFKLEALQEGFYTLYIKAKGLASKYSQKYHIKGETNLSLPAITLSLGGSIRGRLLDEDGRPIKDAEIRASGPSYEGDRTKEDGSFFIEGLLPGEYHLFPAIDGYLEKRGRLSVEAGKTEDVGDLRITLLPPEFHLYSYTQVYPTRQRIRMNFSSYRVNEVGYEVYRIDLEGLIKQYGSRIVSEINKIEPATRPIKTWKEDIKYKSKYRRLYGKRINIPPLNPGVYLLVARPEGLNEKRGLFLVTDLGIITKESSDEIIIHSVNLRDSKPLSTEIRIYSEKGLIKKGNTDRNGIWRVPAINKELKPLIFARSGNHIAMVYSGGESWGFGQGQRNYMVYIYTDRPVYRPNQEVFFKGIVRRIEDGGYSLPSQKDVAIEVKDTNGTPIYREILKPNNYGSFNHSFSLTSEPPLGTYTITAEIDGETHQANFKVLEYRKPEYTISIDTDKKRYVRGEVIKVNVSAIYYFGLPVSDAKVSYFVYENLRPTSFEEGEEGYFFGYYPESGPSYGRLVTQGEMVTDQNGGISFEFPTDDVRYDSDYTIEVRIVDPSRREVTERETVLVTRGKFDLRILQERYLYTPKEKVRLTLMAMDYDNNVVSTPVTFKVFMEYWNKEKGLWERKEVERFRTERKTDNRGEAGFIFIPERPGDYKVFAQAVDDRGNIITTECYIWVSGYNYGYEYSRAGLKLISDRKGYNPGERARILIQTPMKDASFLMTIEGKRIYDARIIRVRGNSRLVDISIKKEYMPNVYLSLCTAYKGKFYISHLNLNISAEERFLAIDITTDKTEYQPSEKVSYRIKTKDRYGRPVSAEVSLGVVDSSIYAISKEIMPDIKRYFYGMRPNYIITRHSFPRFYEAGASKEERAVHIRKGFKDTAFWLPDIITDENGEAKVEVELPENLTAWKATAKAHTIDTLVGENTKEIITKKDIIARLETPRFLVEKDEVLLTGIIHNYTKDSQEFTIGIRGEGLEILDEPNTKREIEPKGRVRIDWKALVQKGKEAVITLYASSIAGSDGMELRIPILPHGIPKREVKNGEISAPKLGSIHERIRIPERASLETANLNIFLSPSLILGLFDSLDYLANYPYGCVEQTMSAFLPDVVIAEMLKNIPPSVIPFERYKKLERELPRMVRRGLDRLYSLQRDDGGWGWWGHDEADPYMTAYVLFGLKKAKDAGYQVNTERIGRGINLLKELYKREQRPDARVFIVYSLTENGEKVDIIPLYQERRNLSNYSKALLAIVLHKVGEKVRALEMLEEMDGLYKTIDGSIYWPSSGERYSWVDNSVETTAYALMAYLNIRAEDDKINRIVRWLMSKRQGDRWESTKSTSATLMALTEYIKVSKEIYPEMDVRVYLNDEKIMEERFEGLGKGSESIGRTERRYQSRIEIPASRLRYGENIIRIEKEGKGTLLYSAVLDYIEEEPGEARGGRFKIDREYLLVRYIKNGEGELERKVERINGPVRSGDEIEVRLKIRGDEDYRYIVVEDPIPSGCEILQRIEDIEKGWYYWYSHEEFRDEKAVFFANRWWEGRFDVSYTIRAEVPGDYHILPTMVSSMYFPEINGSGNEDRLRILPSEKR